MNLFCQSVDFKNCSTGAGEKLMLDSQQQRLFLRSCHTRPQISDSLVLNTCNRLEFYFYAKKTFDVFVFVSDFLKDKKSDALNCWNKYKQIFSGLDAARHLFSVAAGIESQIIGENEILAQLKSAYSFALRCNTVKFMFHHLLHSAFRAAKAVRTHTDINTGALSIAQAAAELAADNFAVGKAIVVIVGSGTNAELVLKHLIKKKVQNITIAARNKIAGEQLIKRAGLGRYEPLSELNSCLSDADIVFAATAAGKPLITAAKLQKRVKPLILIDLSVPRNIEPQAGKIDKVKLFDIDSLNKIINENNLKRQTELPKAKAIIDEHMQTFSQWLEGLEVVPVIKRLQESFISLARAEAKKYAPDFAESEKLAEDIARKILHEPVSFLKNGGGEQKDDWLDDEKIRATGLIEKIFLNKKAYR
jgi:glutamyl-tRNA reductase